jgi:chaperonin GroES
MCGRCNGTASFPPVFLTSALAIWTYITTYNNEDGRNPQECPTMKIRPLHDRVIVKRLEEDRTSPGGIAIPDTAAEKPVHGTIIAVGRGKILESGHVRPCDLKVGEKILFGKYSGTEVRVAGEELMVMREEDVMAVIESK